MSTILPPAAGGSVAPNDPAIDTGRGTGLWKDAYLRLRRNPQAIVGAVTSGGGGVQLENGHHPHATDDMRALALAGGAALFQDRTTQHRSAR